MRSGVRGLLRRFYHQRSGWIDGTTRFAGLIREHLEPHYRVLDLGAGAGKGGPVNFRGRVDKVVGIDPDLAVRLNVTIDAAVVGLAESLSFEAGSFDLVFSDWVIEHLVEPSRAADEIYRVLVPGGLFIFRTGNLRHYSYAVARATPHWFHRIVANRARGLGGRNADPYPTYYRMNTRHQVRWILGAAGFVEEELLMVEAEPSYLMFSRPSFLLGVGYERVVNRYPGLEGARACIFGCFRKP